MRMPLPVSHCRGASASLERCRQPVEATGFTLIEIMVVIVILGILAALVVPRFIERPDEARVIAAKTDIAAIMAALLVAGASAQTDLDALTNAAQGALPGAVTGSGVVVFTLDPTGIRVQSDSMFANQTFDTRVLALTRGSPVKLEVSTKLLQKLLSH